MAMNNRRFRTMAGTLLALLLAVVLLPAPALAEDGTEAPLLEDTPAIVDETVDPEEGLADEQVVPVVDEQAPEPAVEGEEVPAEEQQPVDEVTPDASDEGPDDAAPADEPTTEDLTVEEVPAEGDDAATTDEGATDEVPAEGEATTDESEEETEQPTEEGTDVEETPLTATAEPAEEEPLETGSTLDGVDISGHNALINVSKLDADFVIIKATEWNPDKRNYTSYTTNRTNNTYNSYIDQANAALAEGKLIGFYHFVTNPSMGASWTQQAQGFIDAVRDYIGTAVLVLDWEDTSYSRVESNVAGAKAWLDYVYEQTGVRPLIYMNKNCSNAYNWTAVHDAGYQLWGAQYADMKHHTGYDSDPWQSSDPWGPWGSKPTIFQYSSTTTVTGSGGQVDVNKFYGTREDWEDLAGTTERWVESDGDYYFVKDGVVKKGGWVITKKSPTGAAYGTQRYWLDSDGRLVRDQLVQTGASSWSYIRPEGFAVRGRYVAGNGNVYLANDNGKLEAPGWHVSKAYGQGTQRYYVDATAHACVPGYSAAGWDHYTCAAGYVVRGRFVAPNGYVYLADNNGKLAKVGWHVSNAYGQGTQRYFVDPTAHACVPGYSKGGWEHYTRPEGYVVRGTYTTAAGGLVVADNNGRLAGGSGLKNGWLVTNSLGQGTQRYWVEGGMIVRDRLVKTGANSWAFARPEGYVVRGRYAATNGYVYLADNNGKLVSPGWHVTNAYGQGTQRYYVDATAHACVPGYSADGYAHYTTKAGYVLRTTSTEGGVFRSADNNGLLKTGWLITNAFGQGTQRYWQQDGSVVRGQLVQTGTDRWAYARPEGYVVRGRYEAANGYVYLADNNGKLETPGWHVTNAYGQGTQRYYVDATAHACVPGYATGGYAHFNMPEGYVARNRTVIVRAITIKSGKLAYVVTAYQADNNGKLTKLG